ncbi:MAG TPA: SAM-dependent methyltransferase [Actinocrinis sp.]|nr:SAM-dependent methyltransferase [Actinocrinis sp.]
MSGPDELNAQVDTRQAHPARMYDYYLGGRDNYEVDREAAERIITVVPEIVAGARANRAFLQRAVRTLVAEHGIRQIIDVGTGIPTSPNTHEVAQAIAPQTRVVYVDNDPIVRAHAEALLTEVGHTAFVLGDVREPESFLEQQQVVSMIDFSQPVALLLVALMHFVPDHEDPAAIVARLRDALPDGSYLVLTHATMDRATADTIAPIDELLEVYAQSSAALTMRSRARVLEFFEGFDLLEPGLSTVGEWRLGPEDPPPQWLGIYCGVGRKR